MWETKDKIKNLFKYRGLEGMEWIHLALDRTNGGL
jgi:hypothetical protein